MNPLNQISTSRIDVRRASPVDLSRPLSAVISSLAPLPSSALFLGLAEDGLPVLFNLRVPSPDRILISADAGAGKTRLLQTVARAIEFAHDASRVRYAVLTASPSEWAAFEHSSHCDGVLAFHHALTTGYLHCAALGQPSDLRAPSSLVLLIDGFDSLVADGDLRPAVQALLQSPPPSGVVLIVTLNTSGALVPDGWLDVFNIRLFGYLRDRSLAASLSLPDRPFAGDVQPPSQFVAREREAWLPFWLPEID